MLRYVALDRAWTGATGTAPPVAARLGNSCERRLVARSAASAPLASSLDANHRARAPPDGTAAALRGGRERRPQGGGDPCCRPPRPPRALFPPPPFPPD